MKKKEVILTNPGRFAEAHEISRDKLVAAAEKATNKLEQKLEAYTEGFPGTSSVNYKYELGINKNWECGMHTGTLWLAYEITGNKKFREAAEKHLDTYEKRLDENIGLSDHDVGFVFTPSCVAAYKITGSERARELALRAANHLYDKGYSKKGGFILRCFGSEESAPMCRTMMDTMMNAPLFYWAAEQTGDSKFKDAAISQNTITGKYLIRDDSSSFHHYQFEVGTHKPLHGLTFQGYADDSCWARGHSWGVYGFPIGYSYTKNEDFADLHKNITYYMLNRLPDDCITYWDYAFTQGSDEPRDSSSGAISICGMNEMCRYLPDDAPQKKVFESASNQMLEALIDKCTGKEEYEYDGLICHVTHALPQGISIDECAVYGDYFYLEALLRYLKPDWKMYW